MASSVFSKSCVVTVLLLCAGAAGAVACSDSDPAAPPGEGVDAGGTPDGSTGDATGPDGGDGAASTCTATTPVTSLGDVGAEVFGMVLTDDFILLRDFKVGLDTGIPGVKTGGVIRIPKAGGAPELALAPSAGDRKIGGYFAEGNTLYAIDAKAGEPTDNVIVRKTLPGGAVEPLGITGLFDGGVADIVASDATNLYFRAYSAGGNGYGIFRAPKAGGAVELVTRFTDAAIKDVFNVHLVGTTFWFTKIESGTKSTFYTAPADGNDVTPTKIDPPNRCIGNIHVTAAGAVCHGDLKVLAYDPTFVNEKILFDGLAAKTTSAATPILVDGTRVLVVESSATPAVPLRAVPIAGGPVTNLACDRARIVELEADATSYYWTEDRGSPITRTVYKMAK